MLSKILVQKILEKALEFQWSLQGFGMLRTYLDKDRVYRLQVWGKRYRVDNVSLIHDHPWNFKSTIIAGKIFNTRYQLRPYKPDQAMKRGESLFNEKVIVAGEGGGVEGETQTVILNEQPFEEYSQGDTYTQRWNEIHKSEYIDGSVTIIEREWPKKDRDRALVYYPNGEQWVSAEPRPATPEEILDITKNALERWF